MLPLFLVFLMIVLWLAASATNIGALALQRQRLQSQTDQAAISNYFLQGFVYGQTLELKKCSNFEMPIKLIGLPTEQEICVQSAAR